MSGLWMDQLVVVETEEDHFLGQVDLLPDGVVRVRSGFRGHPHLLDAQDVTSIVRAEDHPLVDLDDGDDGDDARGEFAVAYQDALDASE